MRNRRFLINISIEDVVFCSDTGGYEGYCTLAIKTRRRERKLTLWLRMHDPGPDLLMEAYGDPDDDPLIVLGGEVQPRKDYSVVFARVYLQSLANEALDRVRGSQQQRVSVHNETVMLDLPLWHWVCNLIAGQNSRAKATEAA